MNLKQNVSRTTFATWLCSRLLAHEGFLDDELALLVLLALLKRLLVVPADVAVATNAKYITDRVKPRRKYSLLNRT